MLDDNRSSKLKYHYRYFEFGWASQSEPVIINSTIVKKSDYREINMTIAIIKHPIGIENCVILLITSSNFLYLVPK